MTVFVENLKNHMKGEIVQIQKSQYKLKIGSFKIALIQG